jgi:lipid II:glycine glycyltransferase (peptidoglycan interpeptide bridge formation enzyme)
VFKKGFGGEEVNYPGAFDLPLDPLMYRLINLAEPFKVPLAKFVKLFSGKK